MGQKSDKFVQSDSVDDWSGVHKQSTPAPSTANTDHSHVSCKTDGETNKGFWRRIVDNILGQDVTPEDQKNYIFSTFSDPLFPMVFELESNNDAVQNPVAGELDWDLDIQLENIKNPSVFGLGANYGTYETDEMFAESAVFAETSVQDGLKVEDPADVQTPVHSMSDDDIQYPDDPWFDFIDDRGEDQIPPLPLILLSQEKLEDDEDPNVTIELFEVNGRQYKIGRKLGEGSFGVVYEGTCVQDGLKVALKAVGKTVPIIQDYINIPGYPEPLPREIGLHLLATNGENVPVIVQLLDWQDFSEYIVIVLEHPFPCENGISFIKHNGGSITENIGQTIFWQVTKAAEICCKRGVFHRDIKLENFLINPNTLEVKMIDFGVADLLKTSAYKEFIGTIEYGCPEYFKTGEYHGKPATVYSMGVLLFAMLTGYFPNSTDLHQINEKTWSKDGLTKECCDLIQACLQANPDERIHLEKILDHAWFETPVHSGSDVSDEEGDQIPPFPLTLLSQEKLEGDEDPKVRTEKCCDLIQACLQPNPDERIHLKKILDHAWFEDKDPADGLQTPDHIGSDDFIQYPDDAGSDVSDEGEVQILPFPSISLSQEKLEDDEDPKVRTEIEINGRQYKIGRMLGEGRFGAVYEGTRVQDGLKMALKVVVKTEDIIQDYINIPGYPEPLPREIGLHLLASMGGFVPVIVQLLGWQDHPNRYMMVLEHPFPCEDGISFMKHNGGSITENIAQAILGQVTEAANICCKRGVFHRDIKLENFLINPNTLEVKIIDFGCGDLLKTSAYKEYIGTREYACPEYFKTGEYHGKPATVYSLGVLLFVMVFGHFPNSTDLHQINKKTWSKDGLTKECCDLIQACLQANPDERIHLEKIVYHAWFEVEDPADSLQTPVHSGSDDVIQYPNVPLFDLIDDREGDQIPSSHSISLSQEKLEGDEDPKVRIEKFNGRQYEIDRMVDKSGFGAINEGTCVMDGLKVALKVVGKNIIRLVPILLRMI